MRPKSTVGAAPELMAATYIPSTASLPVPALRAGTAPDQEMSSFTSRKFLGAHDIVPTFFG